MPVLPVGTDVRPRRPPLANYLLILANVLVFVFTDYLGGVMGAQWKSLWALYAAVPEVGQYVTYQFLHGDVGHLLGNMLFLWVFGNAVCDRMGSLPYLLFYLAGGIFAGFVFALASDHALMGASGSIAAVTTAFLVLFPRVNITMLLLLFVITAFRIPAMFLIVFKIILWDNVIAPSFGEAAISSVAYSAHLGGYAFGFFVALLLLAVRALPRQQFDLLALIHRWQRRTGYLPASAFPQARPVNAEELSSRPLEEIPLTASEELRAGIAERLAARDPAGAAEQYLRLIQLDPGQVLPRQAQLEVANALARSQQQAAAAVAYESFLSAYPGAPDAHQVQLLLGLIYGRYLRQLERAAMHLRAALGGLTHPAQRALAEDELRQTEAQLARGQPGTS